MQNFWQDSEHHVWIVREKSKKRRGKKGLIGLSEERGRTFWGRSQAWNQENSFNIPNPGGVAVLQEGREGGGRDECMRYDEIRAEGGGEKKTGWASDGTAGLASPGEHRGMRGGAITTPQRTKGGKECVSVLIFMCACVCVASARRASYSTTHNDSPPSSLQSMSRLPIENDCGPMRSPSLPMWTN